MISSPLFSVMIEQKLNLATLITAVIAVLAWVFPFPDIGEKDKNDKDNQQEKAHKRNYYLKYRIIVFLICMAALVAIINNSNTGPGRTDSNTPPPQEADIISSTEITPTPTPEITPTTKLESGEWKEVEESSPGPSDMAGHSDIQAPQNSSWLAARETRYAYAPHGAAVYIYKGPSLGYEKVNGEYGVADGTELTLLALENGMYLVKTGNGLLGWINTSGTIETRLIDSMPQLAGSYWIYSKGTGDAYTFACKFDSSLKLVGFRLSDGKEVTWTCRSAGRVLVFDEMKFIWDGEQFTYETQAYLWVDPDQTFDKYS